MGIAGPRSVDACDLAFGLKVRQHGKAQLTGLVEGEMTPDAVHRDAGHFGMGGLKLWRELVEERHLIAAHRTPISSLKRGDRRPAPEVAQGDAIVRRNLQSKVGRRNIGRRGFRRFRFS